MTTTKSACRVFADCARNLQVAAQGAKRKATEIIDELECILEDACQIKEAVERLQATPTTGKEGTEVVLVSAVDIDRGSFGETTFYLLDIKTFEKDEGTLGLDAGTIFSNIASATWKMAKKGWGRFSPDDMTASEFEAKVCKLIASIPERALWSEEDHGEPGEFHAPKGMVLKRALTTFIVFQRDCVDFMPGSESDSDLNNSSESDSE